MAENETLPVGTPIWCDLASNDVDAARTFYGELFGWEVSDVAPPEYGGYAMFKQGGKRVAGTGPTMDGAPSVWNTYVRSVDAAATAQKVRDAGGEVVAEPMQIMDAGTLAVFKDPSGAYISVWQTGTNTGGELFNEPVSMTWNELNTRDIDTAKRFYPAVFGWQPSGDGYIEWKLDGRTVAGCMDMNTVGLPDSIPPHWLVYFSVKNVDETAQRVTELGGTVNMPARDIPDMGRFAVVGDPQGAVFAIFAS